MTVKDEIRTGNLKKNEVSLISRDVGVFPFFLFLSFCLWYLVSLGKEIEAGIRYPVKYINLPKERMIIEESDIKLNLYLKGPGYSILKLKLAGKKDPVLIDFSKVNYKRVPESKTLDFFIITSSLIKSLNIQIRSGCEITSIKPDTIFFTLEKVHGKSIRYIQDNRIVNSDKTIL